MKRQSRRTKTPKKKTPAKSVAKKPSTKKEECCTKECMEKGCSVACGKNCKCKCCVDGKEGCCSKAGLTHQGKTTRKAKAPKPKVVQSKKKKTTKKAAKQSIRKVRRNPKKK